MCNNDHNACARGILPPNMLNCPTSYNILAGSNFNFVTFEMRDVDTFGKGKPYKTLVKVTTPLDYFQFLQKFRFRIFYDKGTFFIKTARFCIICQFLEFKIAFRAEFSSYAEHIVAAWFLRSTKLELLDRQSQLRNFLTMVSDFAENILVVRKMETSDQFFHRSQICLFGTVCTLPSSSDESKKETVSHLITSDLK